MTGTMCSSPSSYSCIDVDPVMTIFTFSKRGHPFFQGWSIPLQSGSAPCQGRAVHPIAESSCEMFKFSLPPLFLGWRGRQCTPFWGSEGHVRGQCSRSESPQQSKGSNQVTFQGIRQTVGIKSFTWKLALYLQALLLSPSPTLFLSLLPSVLSVSCM